MHDAFLLLAPLASLDEDMAALRAVMEAAGTAVVGIPVGTDVKNIKPPERYMDERCLPVQKFKVPHGNCALEAIAFLLCDTYVRKCEGNHYENHWLRTGEHP